MIIGFPTFPKISQININTFSCLCHTDITSIADRNSMQCH